VVSLRVEDKEESKVSGMKPPSEHSWFLWPVLARYTGAYTALFTFAVTVKNNWLISTKQFDIANNVFPHICMSNAAAFTNNPHGTAALATGRHALSEWAHLNTTLLINLEGEVCRESSG
jgi:hypothetical protein